MRHQLPKHFELTPEQRHEIFVTYRRLSKTSCFVNVAVPGSEESTSGDAERSGNVPEDASAIHIWMIS